MLNSHWVPFPLRSRAVRDVWRQPQFHLVIIIETTRADSGDRVLVLVELHYIVRLIMVVMVVLEEEEEEVPVDGVLIGTGIQEEEEVVVDIMEDQEEM